MQYKLTKYQKRLVAAIAATRGESAGPQWCMACSLTTAEVRINRGQRYCSGCGQATLVPESFEGLERLKPGLQEFVEFLQELEPLDDPHTPSKPKPINTQPVGAVKALKQELSKKGLTLCRKRSGSAAPAGTGRWYVVDKSTGELVLAQVMPHSESPAAVMQRLP